MRYVPAVLEVVGLIAFIAGSALFHPALGVAALGVAAVMVGYSLEDQT